MSSPIVSFVLATHNRRAILLETLAHVRQGGLPAEAFETIVVDNASTDGTAAAVHERFPDVTILALRENRGSCAKGLAVAMAKGEHVVFLDDDSYPRPGDAARMIQHFQDDARLGAAGYAVHLPNGRMECGALPNVFVGCGVGFRSSALRAVGGLDASLFMQAEEYDLTFRLAGAGWRVRVFDDLHVEHRKTNHARISERTTYYDTRNNLLVASRYLPDNASRIYRTEWHRRYRWLATLNGHLEAFGRGVRDARRMGQEQRTRYCRRRLPPERFQAFFCWDDIERQMASLFDARVRRVAFADLGKNIYAFHRGATRTGLSVLAIGDDRFCRATSHYRHIPVVPLNALPDTRPDAIIIANCASCHAAKTAQRVTNISTMPVHAWFAGPSVDSESSPLLADEYATDPAPTPVG